MLKHEVFAGKIMNKLWHLFEGIFVGQTSSCRKTLWQNLKCLQENGMTKEDLRERKKKSAQEGR